MRPYIRRYIILIAAFFTLGMSSAFSQQSISTTGADIVSDGGSVCFTVGQLLYTADSGEGSTTHGVQQIYRQCIGDYTGDGVLNVFDLLDLLVQFPCDEDCTGDITGDGMVDITDLLYFLSLFGTVCNP